MQRMMLAAVEAIKERLIAPRYLMQISAQLAFSSTKHVLLKVKVKGAMPQLGRGGVLISHSRPLSP